MTARARFDKAGSRLPDTGHGCGCRMCAESNYPRYERRTQARVEGKAWHPLHRRLARLARTLLAPTRAQQA